MIIHTRETERFIEADPHAVDWIPERNVPPPPLTFAQHCRKIEATRTEARAMREAARLTLARQRGEDVETADEYLSALGLGWVRTCDPLTGVIVYIRQGDPAAFQDLKAGRR